MAKVDKKIVVPEPITTFVLELTPGEANGLAQLIDYGVDIRAITELKLNDLRHALNNSAAQSPHRPFSAKATLARAEESGELEDDYDADYNDYDYDDPDYY